jgi:hypothetical protein
MILPQCQHVEVFSMAKKTRGKIPIWYRNSLQCKSFCVWTFTAPIIDRFQIFTLIKAVNLLIKGNH